MNKYIILLALLFPIQLFSQLQITNFGNLNFLPGANVTFYGNFSNNGTFQDTGMAVSFHGTINQHITGSTPPSFNNCIIDNNSGVSMFQAIKVKNVITLTNGQLSLNTNTLTVLNGSTLAVIRTNGSIISEQTNNSGKIAWNINNAVGSHIYPFSTSSGQYIPFTLNLTAGNIGMATIATYPTAISNLPFPSSPDIVTHVNNGAGADNSINTVDRFWQIEKNGISGIANITFVAATIEVGSIANLNAYRWNSGLQGWETPPGVQSSTSNSVTVQNVTTFSPWTLAGNNVPLPIELLSFTATLNNKEEVDLNWVTATEINNHFFTIERSIDGVQFEVVEVVQGAGNSNEKLLYHTIDPNPYAGTSYYRLQQTDFDSNVRISNMESIYMGSMANASITVFPNPSDGQFSMALNGFENETILTIVTDITGKVYYSKNMVIDSGHFVHQMTDLTDLSSGLYMLQIHSAKKTYTTKLIIQ